MHLLGHRLQPREAADGSPAAHGGDHPSVEAEVLPRESFGSGAHGPTDDEENTDHHPDHNQQHHHHQLLPRAQRLSLPFSMNLCALNEKQIIVNDHQAEI